MIKGVKKYITNNNNILETLNKYGVMIIPNIINQQECNAIKQGMWNYYCRITSSN